MILVDEASNDVPRRVNALPFVDEHRSLISGDDRRDARAGRAGSTNTPRSSHLSSPAARCGHVRSEPVNRFINTVKLLAIVVIAFVGGAIAMEALTRLLAHWF